MDYLSFYRGKHIFVTGHTGFKGAWLCRVLSRLGAHVTGYALPPPTTPSLFELLKCGEKMDSVLGDICDFPHLYAAFCAARPEIVFHLAAQPLVRRGYQEPVRTYATNVMGTVNLLECVRQTDTVRSVVNVTTDKVYLNREWAWGYRENEPLCGFDPYSNSKSCAELVTYSYKNSFFEKQDVAISTARAGNVIGGGDFAPDRILPDCVRAAMDGCTLQLRNPHAMRPYQHVLEPIFAYLLIAAKSFQDRQYADSYNVGPDECDCITNEALVCLFASAWGEGFRWQTGGENGPHEATFLKLDSSKIKAGLSWKPHWNIVEAVRRTVEWGLTFRNQGDLEAITDHQIEDYMKTVR